MQRLIDEWAHYSSERDDESTQATKGLHNNSLAASSADRKKDGNVAPDGESRRRRSAVGKEQREVENRA